MATAAPGDRIVTLDVVRGVAVMGILAMNILSFALPPQAYMNPAAYGSESAADYVSWAFSFVFIDGKMRALFSILFGASMLLVIQRAAAAGRSPAAVHFNRMIWLLVFGLVHFYLIWFGDILTGYAQVGMIAYLFHRLPVRSLFGWAGGLLLVQTLILAGITGAILMLETAAAQPGAPAAAVREWATLQAQFGVPDPAVLRTELVLHRGGYIPLFADRVEGGAEIFANLLIFGWETLAYFLLGMALLKSGFLRGSWSSTRYRRWLLAGFGIGVPVHVALAAILLQDDFSVPMQFACALTATTPFRPLMVIAIAALVILLARRGGAVVDRIAAAGRAAFTNYIGTSILMTTLFYGYGFGLFGSLSRIELWPVVIAAWVLMLLWSKPFLERFRYGPFEWLWRSLARRRLEPLRRVA